MEMSKKDVVDADDAARMTESVKKFDRIAVEHFPHLPAEEVKLFLEQHSESEKTTDIRKQPHLDWEPGKPCPCCDGPDVVKGTVPVFDIHEKEISCPGCGDILRREVWNCSSCSWHREGEILMPGCPHANKKLKLKEWK